MQNSEFWEYLERLAADSPLVIDRPKGSAHPRYPDMIYPLDYGYLDDTTSVDGGGLDAWRGSLPEPQVVGVLLTVDLYKKDAEFKVMLGCSQGEIDLVRDFLSRGMMRAEYFPRQENG